MSFVWMFKSVKNPNLLSSLKKPVRQKSKLILAIGTFAKWLPLFTICFAIVQAWFLWQQNQLAKAQVQLSARQEGCSALATSTRQLYVASSNYSRVMNEFKLDSASQLSERAQYREYVRLQKLSFGIDVDAELDTLRLAQIDVVQSLGRLGLDGSKLLKLETQFEPNVKMDDSHFWVYLATAVNSVGSDRPSGQYDLREIAVKSYRVCSKYVAEDRFGELQK